MSVPIQVHLGKINVFLTRCTKAPGKDGVLLYSQHEVEKKPSSNIREAYKFIVHNYYTCSIKCPIQSLYGNNIPPRCKGMWKEFLRPFATQSKDVSRYVSLVLWECGGHYTEGSGWLQAGHRCLSPPPPLWCFPAKRGFPPEHRQDV